MARPPRFDTDQLLDAAVRLAASFGPAGVTMAAVAKEAGAPSGSLYHRFAGRSALLAEVWLRTVERFQDSYARVLAAHDDAREAGRAAARHVVAWSRAHPEETRLLLYGPGDFGREGWAQEYRSRAERGNRRIFGELDSLAATLGVQDTEAVERLTLALVDLPLSVVRRHLREGGTLPAHAEALVEDCATALLDTLPGAGGRAHSGSGGRAHPGSGGRARNRD
ncbi:TetR/AcrR family transcriptional regulator [Streptomyces sp. B15]|uniref:TetR/AcrR family transcriptional regulator n=1 Tax=Streptomyces sp. B15 TaxID=1537797 RepID=UPI001B37BA6B|nr:TetR/AcrR family transcriptional regulator [Streptomyces sp. B15]MBQ1124340.1 TetR/AcrR family transcriptional regulator [Streptomyces sp. B15]